jgi:hypothetical protein
MKSKTTSVVGAGPTAAVRSLIASIAVARKSFGHIFRNNPLDG